MTNPMTPLNEQIERKAKELAIIGDDNADWIAVARHVLRCEIEVRIEELRFLLPEGCVFTNCDSKWLQETFNFIAKRIKELEKQLQRLKEA